jgi:hypothetical protein
MATKAVRFRLLLMNSKDSPGLLPLQGILTGLDAFSGFLRQVLKGFRLVCGC